MPVHKLGYRGWNGKKTPQWNRWWIITETGFRIAFQSAWVRRILLICWLPVLYWGLGLFMIEQALENRIFENAGNLFVEAQAVEGIPDVAQAELGEQVNKLVMKEIIDEIEGLDMLPATGVLAAAVESNDENLIRHTVWSWLLMTFFRYPQGTAILFLLGFITPGLISQDVRSRAFLLYFSRPIGRLEYILGKLSIPVAFLMLITTVPAIFLFLFGITLSPDLGVLNSTWDIPIRIVLASLVVIVPTCSIALMLSSVTQESRFATFAWFSVWALGHAAWFAIVITQAIRLRSAPFDDIVQNDPIVIRWSIVSLYNNLTSVQSWIFGFQSFESVWPSLAMLILISLISLRILYRGVSAPVNV